MMIVNTLPPSRVVEVYITHPIGFKALEYNAGSIDEVGTGRDDYKDKEINVGIGRHDGCVDKVNVREDRHNGYDDELIIIEGRQYDNSNENKNNDVETGDGRENEVPMNRDIIGECDKGSDRLHDVNMDYNSNSKSDPTYYVEFIDLDG